MTFGILDIYFMIFIIWFGMCYEFKWMAKDGE